MEEVSYQVRRSDRARRVRVTVDAVRGVEVVLPRRAPEREAAAAIRELRPWIERRVARAEIEPRLQRACAVAGTSYSGLTIRGQRTRWASCSRSGSMSFNWRLLLAPEPVLEYVIWHEVCHLEVMDHSARFWRLVARRSPGYREQVRWLRTNGATLVL